MKTTGIVRRVDDLGRIVIPKETRRELGIVEGTPMEMFTKEDCIIFKRYYTENKLSEILKNLDEAVKDTCVDLGPEKTEGIKQYIHEIQMLLKN
ncbi:AbrB/MazE/SpoVT family DNA-binding domain-containing protein [Hungatella hathewayi]|uniref:AbrB/MazE/SpoVT family DNA-binding domain-containing protein n=1 Tax=Hungatella hathewayi TaxID=154046 RepID=UPI003569CFF9